MQLTDLIAKRTTFMNRIQDYKVAVESGDEVAINNALDDANQAGMAFSDEIGQLGISGNHDTTDLFSRGDLYNDQRKTTIEKAWGLLKLWSSITYNRTLNEVNNYAWCLAQDNDYLYVGWNDDPNDASFKIYRKSDWSLVENTPALGRGVRGLAVDDDYIYAATLDKPYFVVMNKNDFSIVSETPTVPGDSSYGYSVRVDGDRVYFGHNEDGGFKVFEKDTWNDLTNQYPNISGDAMDWNFDDNYIYFASGGLAGNKFYVIDKETLELVNGTPEIERSIFDVSIDENYVYIGVSLDPFLYVIDKSDWSIVNTGVTGLSYCRGVINDERYVYLGLGDAPHLMVLDKEDWSEVSENINVGTLDSLVKALLLDDNHLYIGVDTADGGVVVADLNY